MRYSSPLITIMANAAYKAAKGLCRDFGEVEQLQVSRKGPADFVTSADHKAEKTLIDDLQKSRPKFGFLLEEGGVIEGSDESNRWIIDPLDGTTNFLHGIPHFAISIGLERDRKMHAGVIYDPLRDELFWGETGGGAFVNSKRLRVSSRTKMQDILLATGMPFKGHLSHPQYPEMLNQVWQKTSGIRRYGSASLDLAYVAAGRFDGFWEFALSPWDISAGMVIVREAGGIVTEVDCNDNPMKTGNILATNGHIHGSVRSLLAKSAHTAL